MTTRYSPCPEARMTLEELTTEVERIIQIADSEVAHVDEDELHLKLLTQFLPDEWRAQIERLTAAPFSRWYA